jgi:DNA topoisomerase I
MLDSQDSAFSSPVASPDLGGLRYVCDDGPAIRRKRAGRGFVYFYPKGKRIADPAVLRRIKSLVIPPAWADVWICPSAHGHLQATGRDARGRKQYRYHSAYREAREEAKYEHLLTFAEVLPTIRTTVAEHMSLRGLPQLKVVATVVHLLEATLIRVGNDEYARQNESYGLTTLKSGHVAVEGSEIRFRFVGKSGKKWSLAMRNRRVAKIIRACQELPGQELLQYLDEQQELRAVSSGDVNDYLRAITGADITAKDFRTWAGTVLMARFLAEAGGCEDAAGAKRAVSAAVKRVAAALGNTPAVCRKSYIHPGVCSAYLDGGLVLEAGPVGGTSGLRPDEIALLALLRASGSAP